MHTDPIVGVLTNQLEAELRGQASKNPPYVIIATDDRSGSEHLYVAWDAWKNLGDRTRSEIIMDAYERVFPDRVLDVTVAMGLTKREARRMGLTLS